MTRRLVKIVCGTTAILSTLALGTSAAFASSRAPASKPSSGAPSAPSGLHATETTDTSVSLAWNLSNDGASRFTYTVQALPGGLTAEKTGLTQTSYVWPADPEASYTFAVFAVNSVGQDSADSNSLTVTTPSPPPPPAPTLSIVNESGWTVTLAASEPAGTEGVAGERFYRDGAAVSGSSIFFGALYGGPSYPEGTEEITVIGLSPATTYNFAAVAVSDYSVVSPSSNTVTVATLSTTDTAPPSAPTDLIASLAGCGEVDLSWNASTDTSYPSSDLYYEVFIDGAHTGTFDDVLGETADAIFPGVTGNVTVSIVAIDPAGNASAAGTVTFGTANNDDC